MSFSQDYRPFQPRAREARQPSVQRLVDVELARIAGHLREKLLAGRVSVIEDTIHLASMLRVGGEPLRAYKLHRSLLARLEITPREKSILLLETGADLLAMRKGDLGVSHFQQCLAADRNHRHALDLLAKAHEYAGEFQKAAMLVRRLVRLGQPEKARLAFLLSESAYALLGQKSPNKARKAAEEAMALDPSCPAAPLARADALLIGRAFDETVAALGDFVARWPDLTFMAIKRLEDAHYRSARYAELEDTLRAFLRRHPDNPHLLYFLGKILRKKKRREEGHALFKSALELAALDVHAMRELVHYNLPDAPTDILALAREFFERLRAARRAECPHCHHVHAKFNWFCPRCLTFGIPTVRYVFAAS